ncbi:MAG: permease-like cell division protein FtsX [Candidatus Berkelbacteria bacterium]|nr:permease-like cell division protein FtsX [Candidatus Berkelbacteria bacterium]
MTRIKRIFREAFVDFWRNGWLSVTATLIMTLALLTTGVFLVMYLSTNKIIHDLKDKVDIVVNFKDEASESLIQQLRSELMARPQIKSVKYISKADALEEFKSRPSVKVEVRQMISSEDNPLPRGLQIQSVDLKEFEYVSNITKNPIYAPHIDSSSYDDNKSLIENINATTKFAERLGLALSSFFMLIAILVVFNTIKLAVYFRAKEMEIMRLVGASESFVKTPFLIEGFLYGFFATVVSTGLIYFTINLLAAVSKNTILDKFIVRLLPIYYQEFWFIVGVELFIGTVLGLGASWLSIRKNVKG